MVWSCYSVCRFYIGCDLCSNWYHGECVGITEKEAKKMDDYICMECKRAQEGSTEELYCICRTPYDESQYVTVVYFWSISYTSCFNMTKRIVTQNRLLMILYMGLKNTVCTGQAEYWTFFGLVFVAVFVFRFYIGCDRCQNWYHGRCVGILQSEATHIDEYVCPQCQSTEEAMTVLSPLTDKDYEGLKRILRSLQVIMASQLY